MFIKKSPLFWNIYLHILLVNTILLGSIYFLAYFQIVNRLLMMFTLLSIIHFIYITALFSRKIILPLHNLYQAFDQVAKGNYEHKVLVIDRSEIGKLTYRFNDMIDHISKANEKTNYEAYHDYLTGLPNRRHFQKTLQKLIEKRAPFSLIFCDLDGFKIINDELGHNAGDEVLRQAAHRLKEIIQNPSEIFRLGGDEFIIIMLSIDKQLITQKLEVLLETIAKPIPIQSLETSLTASIGISRYPVDGTTLDSILKHADLAMYEAKNEGKNKYCFFSSDMSEKLVRKSLIQQKLNKAIANDELELYYQPQICTESNQVVGVEALLRWNNGILGSISPQEFIPIAEETNLIHSLSQWVIQEACKIMNEWKGSGIKPVKLAINISPKYFHSISFIADVKRLINEANIDPTQLEFEITEGIMIDFDQCQEIFQELIDLGITISIDDFGTGYSSLKYLQHIPIKNLKIDRSFIRDLPKNDILIKSIISMAHNLKYLIIAEGVETSNQLQFLQQLNCDFVQGYFFSKPLPAEEIKSYLKTF